MSYYYVDYISGTNDGSHGTGSGSNAWKTFTYALGTSGIPLTSGPHFLFAASGTYLEGTTTGLNITRLFGTLTTIVGDTNNPSNITIKPASTDYQTALLFGSSSNIRFEGVKFTYNGAGTGNTLLCRHNANTTNLQFYKCEFATSGLASSIGYSCINTTGIDSLLFNSCSFDCDNGTNQYGIHVDMSGGYTNNVNVTNCIINATSYACNLTNILTGTIIGGTFTSNGPQVVSFNRDGSTAILSGTFYISGANIVATGIGGHSLLIGPNSLNSEITDCFVNGYGGAYGIVDKGISTNIHDCLMIGGARNALYFKSTLNSSARRCSCIAIHTGSYAIETGDTGTRGTVTGTIVQDCSVFAAPNASCLLWLGHDNTDNVKLTSYFGSIGTTLPSNGYGTPKNVLGPALPAQHKWSIT